MVDDRLFPRYPPAALTRADIVAYLAPYLQKGWEIYRGEGDGQFVIRLLDNFKLFIELIGLKWRVSTGLAPNESIAIWAYPETVAELDTAIQRAVPLATSSGRRLEWSGLPTAVRLHAGQPASNLSRVVTLIGTSEVDSVFDAYLDNKGLETLLDIATLGVRVASTVRLLTSSKMVQPAKGLPRLTVSYVRAWMSQLQLNGVEVRFSAYSGHQRRFALLSGGQSLILGPSLNNMAVNEASHVESDTSDRAFFEAEWVSATVLQV